MEAAEVEIMSRELVFFFAYTNLYLPQDSEAPDFELPQLDCQADGIPRTWRLSEQKKYDYVLVIFLRHLKWVRNYQYLTFTCWSLMQLPWQEHVAEIASVDEKFRALNVFIVVISFETEEVRPIHFCD